MMSMLMGTVASATAPPTDPSSRSTPDSGAPASGASQNQEEEDDAVLQRAEPDYRLVNLPTTALMPRHGGSFELTHRFAGNLARGSFATHAQNLFGLDQGALVGFEFRFAVARRLQAAVYRTTFDKTFQFHGKYDAVRQRGRTPVSVSAVASVEGIDNFTERRSPALGAVVSRTVSDALAVYATPIWVHSSVVLGGNSRDTFLLGLAGRARLSSTVYVVGEVSPRVSGYAAGRPAFGVGIEKRQGGHLFQLNLTNTFSTTYGQIARGGFPDTLYLGFNLARKFF
jgi:hypothetical protein